MKFINFGVTLLLSTSVFTASAQVQKPSENLMDKIATNLSQSDSIISNEEIKLKAELIFKESVLQSLNSMDTFNEATGLNSEYGKYVAIPAAIASLYFISVGTPKLLNLVNFLTPEEKLKAFTKELRKIEDEINTASKNLKVASIEMDFVDKADNTKVSSAKEALDIRNLEYQAALGRKSMLLKVEPGVLYRSGRMIRGLTKSTLVLGAITLSVSMISDMLILWLPEDVDAFRSQIQYDVDGLNVLLSEDIK